MIKLGTLAMVVLLSVILHFEGVRPNDVQVQERAKSKCKPGDYLVDGCNTQVCAKVGKQRFWVYGYDAKTCCDYGDQYFPLGQTIVVPSTNGQNITLLCQDLGAGPSIQATCGNSLVDTKLNCLLEKIAPNHCPVSDTTTATTISTTISTDWQQYPGPGDSPTGPSPGLASIATGLFGVWGLQHKHSDYSFWRKKKASKGWTQVDDYVIMWDISVGNDSVWGGNMYDQIWRWTDLTQWQQIPGALKQVSVSGVDDEIVWGVKPDNSVQRWTGSSWETVNGRMSMVSCGQTGVWALGVLYEGYGSIYYRTGTYGGVNSAGTGWERVDGGLSWISTGMAGEVWGVGWANRIYKRDGITASNPTGNADAWAWTIVEGPVVGMTTKQVAVFGGTVWGLVTGPYGPYGPYGPDGPGGPDYDIWYLEI